MAHPAGATSEICPLSIYISHHPIELERAVQKVYHYAEDLLKDMKLVFGRFIQVKIMVNVPIVMKKYVLFQDLLKQGISPTDLSIQKIWLENQKQDVVAIDHLRLQGILIGDIPSVAEWRGRGWIILKHGAYNFIPDSNHRVSRQVAYLIFELYNAQFSALLKDVYRNGVTEPADDRFVEEIEHVEHSTLHATIQRLTQLIEAKVLTKAAEYFHAGFKEFHLHYLNQQLKGHSKYVATFHEEIYMNPTQPRIPYKGTWSPPIKDNETREHLITFMEAYFHSKVDTLASCIRDARHNPYLLKNMLQVMPMNEMMPFLDSSQTVIFA